MIFRAGIAWLAHYCWHCSSAVCSQCCLYAGDGYWEYGLLDERARVACFLTQLLQVVNAALLYCSCVLDILLFCRHSHGAHPTTILCYLTMSMYTCCTALHRSAAGYRLGRRLPSAPIRPYIQTWVIPRSPGRQSANCICSWHDGLEWDAASMAGGASSGQRHSTGHRHVCVQAADVWGQVAWCSCIL
jgi:hypothetical protein